VFSKVNFHNEYSRYYAVAVGLIVVRPIGLAGGAAIGGIIGYEYERHIWKKI
jgi:hypothetical protein